MAQRTEHVPERMCIVCRRRIKKPLLSRYIKKDNNLVADDAKRIAGRGVYICRDPKCLAKVQKYPGKYGSI